MENYQVEDFLNPLVSGGDFERERVEEVSSEGDFEDALAFLHQIPSAELITPEMIGKAFKIKLQ